MKRASGVEMVLLNNNVSVVRSDVHVPTFPEYLINLPSTVKVGAIRVIFLRALIHNNLPICHIIPTVFRYIVVRQKIIVLVPSILMYTPWDIRTISSAKDLMQTGLCFVFFVIRLYSMKTPVSSSMIALVIFVI